MTAQRPQPHVYRHAFLPSAAVAFALLFAYLFSAPTFARAATSKQPVDFFGGSGALGGEFMGSPGGIAINQSGAGAGNPGDIYVTDTFDNRIERFARDDHGTPSDGSDDTYSFLSTWGAGVEPSSGTNYQVCTVAEQCSEAIASGVAGGLSNPAGIAVDEDTGDVYIADSSNARVDVYSGEGAFLRAFGFDVVQSGPDDTGTGYETCTLAAGDVCKAGTPGSGEGQIGAIPAGYGHAMGIAVSQANGNSANGTIFLADSANNRVNTYHLDGSFPASIGSASVFGFESPKSVAVDSRGILYASAFKNDGEVERYDTENADGNGATFLAPITSGVNEVQQVTVSATAGTFNLTYNGETTVDLPFNAPAKGNDSTTGQQITPQIDTVEEALFALPSIGDRNLGNGAGVNVNVSGGPGDAGGTSPYRIEFDAGLGAQDVEQIAAGNGATPLSGGSGASAITLTNGQPGLVPGLTGIPSSLATDGDSLYVQRSSGSSHVIQQFGPTNEPGLTAPPSAFDAIHGSAFGSYGFPAALAIDHVSGRIYIGSGGAIGAGAGVYVLDNPTGAAPSASLDSVSNVTATSVAAHGTITPNGTPPLNYHLEYSTDGSRWESGPTVVLGIQSTPQAVNEELSPLGGLEPNTFYHLRLVAERPFFPAVVTPEQTFTTLSSPPLAETTGSPVRSATTLRLDGRLSPQGSATTFHFEYGTQGPCESNPCTSTETHSAGSGGEFELVSQRLEELEPDTTYYYRLVADNGNPGSPAYGEDMTVSTLASDAPLSHGHFPGPPGSDRGWELVSEPDTSGNPVGRFFAPLAAAIADDGDRAVYGVAGGTPLSETGTFATRLFAERTPNGWQTKKIFPTRQQATGPVWENPGGPSDLSTLVVENHSQVNNGEFGIWRLSPGASSVKLFGSPEGLIRFGYLGISEDGSRVLTMLKGTQDPDHPVAPETPNFYDISSGQSPQLINFLPDGSVPPCGVSTTDLTERRSARWISADGSLAFFPSSCLASLRIYVRDFSTEATKLVSGAPFSGPLCDSHFIKSTAGSAYFLTETRLTAEDLEPERCTSDSKGRDDDVYRYDLSDGSLHCLTCLAPGYPTAVRVSIGNIRFGDAVGVAEDGSHIYFVSGRRLLPGAPANGGTYGLDVGSRKLVYVGTSEFISDLGESAMNRTGSVVAFRSKAPNLNALGGQQNGSTFQDYLFDFGDRSLTCVSCPTDGSLPVGNVFELEGIGGTTRGQGANRNQSLDASGEDFIFSTPTPLVPADQNTARAGQLPEVGNDVYEWRAGRLLLVSDGITNWPGGVEAPRIAGIAPSGRDVFFAEAAQLTPDALDGYNRLYDARIGGGFEFPPPPKPCPLEVCQGTPKGAPEEQAPGTQFLKGAEEAAKPVSGRCYKAKVRRKGRCVAKHRQHTKKTHHKAKHNRRTGR